MKIFGLGHAHKISEAVCKELGLTLSSHIEERFPDGELKICTSELVFNSDAIVFHSIAGDAEKSLNDRLCELYFFIYHLKDKGAKQVTAVLPYLAYARSDQKKSDSDPLIHRYTAQQLEASGASRVIVLDVHNISACENAFRCPVVNLEAAPLFCDHFYSRSHSNVPLVVMSPDIGGIKRAEKFRKILEAKSGKRVESAFLEKFRTDEGLEGHRLAGDLAQKDVLIIDDMISTGSTILRAVEVARKNHCGKIKVFATHGIFSKDPERVLDNEDIDEVVVTDSYPLCEKLRGHKKLTVLNCASLFNSVFF